MTSQYRVLYGNLLTSALHGELPSSSLSTFDVLNGPGGGSISMPLDTNPAISVDELTFDGATGIFIERDGVIVGGGIPWTYRADIGSNTLTVNFAGWLSYLRRRTLRATLVYSGVEQTTIATNLIDYAEGVPGGAIGITHAATATGVTRDRTYRWWEHHNVGEQIERLANVNNGFHFRFDTEWQPADTIPTIVFRTSYPPLGRLTTHVFDTDVNCALAQVDGDGSGIVNSVLVAGEGEGRGRVTATRVNADAWNTAPLLQRVLSFSTVRSRTHLVAHGDRMIAQGAEVANRIRLDVHPDTPPNFGSYTVGDRVRVVASYGFVDVDDLFRITKRTLKSAGGSEWVTIDLAPERLYDY